MPLWACKARVKAVCLFFFLAGKRRLLSQVRKRVKREHDEPTLDCVLEGRKGGRKEAGRGEGTK